MVRIEPLLIYKIQEKFKGSYRNGDGSKPCIQQIMGVTHHEVRDLNRCYDSTLDQRRQERRHRVVTVFACTVLYTYKGENDQAI